MINAVTICLSYRSPWKQPFQTVWAIWVRIKKKPWRIGEHKELWDLWHIHWYRRSCVSSVCVFIERSRNIESPCQSSMAFFKAVPPCPRLPKLKGRQLWSLFWVWRDFPTIKHWSWLRIEDKQGITNADGDMDRKEHLPTADLAVA